jgi:hypothetical protein
MLLLAGYQCQRAKIFKISGISCSNKQDRGQQKLVGTHEGGWIVPTTSESLDAYFALSGRVSPQYFVQCAVTDNILPVTFEPAADKARRRFTVGPLQTQDCL